MNATSTKNAYFPQIDGLRAIAVLSVVLYHLDPALLPGGFSGVDVFFVISGFVVSASVAGLDRIGLWGFIVKFYARRIQRIGPALVVCLLVTTLASAIFIPAAWLSGSNQQTGIYAFFGLSNFILARNNNNYFSPITEFNPYTHTWSLGVEEQFYLIFPLFFFLWTFRGRRRLLTVGLFGISFVASVGYSAWLGQTDKTSAFYMIGSRFWQLAAGVLLFQCLSIVGRRFDCIESRTPRWSGGGALVSLALLAYGLTVSKAENFPFPGGIPSVLGTLGLLGVLHGEGRSNFVFRLLTTRVLIFVGKVSYSLYLWHWPVFVIFRWTVGLDVLALQSLAVLISFVLASASYYWIETPLRRSPSLLLVPRYVVVILGLVVLGTSAWIAAWINDSQSAISISTVARNAEDWYPYGANTSAEHPGCVVAVTNTPISTGFVLNYSRHDCGLPVRGPRVFAIGDSHALGYEALYKRYVFETGATVSVYNNGGCPFISLQPWREESAHCQGNAKEAVTDILKNLAPGDVVFLPSLRLPRFADQWVRFSDGEVADKLFSAWASDARAMAVTDAEKLLRKFDAKGARIVFEAPKPIFPSPIFRCVEPYNITNSICNGGAEIARGEIERLRRPILDAFNRLVKSIPSVGIWDPLPVLCESLVRCSAFLNGRPLFFDGDHVSGYGSRLLLPSFLGFVANAVEGGLEACGGNCPKNIGEHTNRNQAIRLAVGDRVEFKEIAFHRDYLGVGWSTPEAWGIWSDGEYAEVALPVQGNPKAIIVEAGALVTPAHPKQNVMVKINGISLKNATLSDRWKNLIEVPIPEDIGNVIARNGLLEIEFRFDDLVSPKQLGLGEDYRSLSLGLIAVTIK